MNNVTVSKAHSWICIGRQGEKRGTSIRFILSDIMNRKFPKNTSFVVVCRRPGEPAGAAYVSEVNSFDFENQIVTWVPSEYDVAKNGEGECQLVCSVENSNLAKSKVYKTTIEKSIGEESSSPTPSYESWTNDVLAAGQAAENAKDEAVSAAAEAHTIFEAGETYTITDVVATGYLSSSKTEFTFSVVLPKSRGELAVNPTTVKLNPRVSGTYLVGSSYVEGGVDFLNNINYSVEIVASSDYCATIKIMIINGTYNGTNNSAVAVYINSLVFEFIEV